MTESTKAIWNSPDLEVVHGYQCPHCGSSNLKKFLSHEEHLARHGFVVCKPPEELQSIPLAKVLCGDCWMVSHIALKD